MNEDSGKNAVPKPSAQSGAELSCVDVVLDSDRGYALMLDVFSIALRAQRSTIMSIALLGQRSTMMSKRTWYKSLYFMQKYLKKNEE